MKGEFRQAMKLMWGSKRMRESFGCSLGVFGFSGILLIQVLFWVITVCFRILGRNPESFSVPEFLGISLAATFLAEPMMPYFAFQIPGKGLRTIPMAKCVLTKGILVNLVLFLEGGMLTTLALYRLGIAISVPEEAMWDDILFLFGLLFFLVAVIHVLLAGLGFCFNKQDSYIGMGYLGALFVNAEKFFGKVTMEPWEALLWHIGFMLVGSVCYYLFLKKKYQKRENVIVQEDKYRALAQE